MLTISEVLFILSIKVSKKIIARDRGIEVLMCIIVYYGATKKLFDCRHVTSQEM